jgi:hypothetical protein
MQHRAAVAAVAKILLQADVKFHHIMAFFWFHFLFL